MAHQYQPRRLLKATALAGATLLAGTGALYAIENPWDARDALQNARSISYRSTEPSNSRDVLHDAWNDLMARNVSDAVNEFDRRNVYDRVRRPKERAREWSGCVGDWNHFNDWAEDKTESIDGQSLSGMLCGAVGAMGLLGLIGMRRRR